MQLSKIPLSFLRPAPYNPRLELTPRDPRYRKLRRSLQDYGLVEPLVWNRRTGHVVGGNQRLKILRELGWEEVPVSVVDLSGEREKALNVVLNNREAQSDWDAARLAEVLEELTASPGVTLEDSGFEQRHLQILREDLAPAPAPATGDSTGGAAGDLARIEVVLRLTAGQYEDLRPTLDALVAEQGLECHVRKLADET